MPSFRQPNFAGGEIAPALYGRTDSDRYPISLRTCRNFIITPAGAALNRPGTKFLNAVYDHNARSRLIPFIYSDTESYVLEFSNLLIRFYKSGAQIESSPGVPYQVVSPYTTAQLPYLRFAQVGDVLTITHYAQTERELTRTSDTSWALAAITYSPVDMWSGGIPPRVNSAGTGAVDLVSDSTHPLREWIYKVTTVAQEVATGIIFESLPATVTEKVDLDAGGPTYSSTGSLGSKFAVYVDKQVRVGWPVPSSPPAQPAGWNNARLLSYRVYRGRGTLFGLLGETTGREFVDIGDEPDYSIQPPRGRNPFEIRNYAETLIRTEEPTAVTFFQQRMALGGTVERPGWQWLSKIGDYQNFDKTFPQVEDGSVEFELASLRREEIRSMVGMDDLFTLTSGGVWTTSDLGIGLVPKAIKHTDEGVSWVPPLVLGDSLLYVLQRGLGVNEIGYASERGKYTATDVSMFATHLFEKYSIEEWTYAKNPHRVVWAVRADGALLSLTYHRPFNTIAWARHDTEANESTGVLEAFVESVCAVPEGEREDAVYLIVRRTIGGVTKRYVERMNTRVVDEDHLEDCKFLDCAITYDSTATLTLSGLSHLEGKAVYVLGDGAVGGPYTVASGAITLGAEFGDGVSVAQVGLRYFSDLECLDLTLPKVEVSTRKKLVSSVWFEVVASRGLWAGEDFESIEELSRRSAGDGYGSVPVYTGKILQRTPSSWNTGGRAVLRQKDPLPIAVHAMIREAHLGEE